MNTHQLQIKLLSSLANECPHTILGPADAMDIAERREHLEKVMAIVGNHVVAVMADLGIKTGDFSNRLSDLIEEDISAPLNVLAGKLAEAAAEDGEPAGTYRARAKMESV